MMNTNEKSYQDKLNKLNSSFSRIAIEFKKVQNLDTTHHTDANTNTTNNSTSETVLSLIDLIERLFLSLTIGKEDAWTSVATSASNIPDPEVVFVKANNDALIEIVAGLAAFCNHLAKEKTYGPLIFNLFVKYSQLVVNLAEKTVL